MKSSGFSAQLITRPHLYWQVGVLCSDRKAFFGSRIFRITGLTAGLISCAAWRAQNPGAGISAAVPVTARNMGCCAKAKCFRDGYAHQALWVSNAKPNTNGNLSLNCVL